MPDTSDIIVGAEHDEIYLGFYESDLEESSITEEQIRDLRRCGVCLGGGGLFMFV